MSKIPKYTSFLWLVLLIASGICPCAAASPPPERDDIIIVHHINDFDITGDGSSWQWNQTEWISLTQRTNFSNDDGRETALKVLYSDTGIYVLFRCDDTTINATFQSDFEELWHEDVVEAFFWPNQEEQIYFEYELSPLNYELPILVSKYNQKQSHWIPFSYSYKNDRKTTHMTSVKGNFKKTGAKISEWTAEFFIPFELLLPMKNIYPVSGDVWRANFYRVDFDFESTSWSWSSYGENFHDIERYGQLQFK